MRMLDKDAKKVTQTEMEDLVVKITKSQRAEISKNRIKMTLKSFYKWLYGDDVSPKIVKWIKIDKSVSNKLPEELLTEEDIASLLNECKNQRDKAIIALLWDTGMRVGELLNLRK